MKKIEVFFEKHKKLIMLCVYCSAILGLIGCIVVRAIAGEHITGYILALDWSLVAAIWTYCTFWTEDMYGELKKDYVHLLKLVFGEDNIRKEAGQDNSQR